MMKIPREEHPRPQMQRDTWETLNGSWEFAFDFSKSGIDREFWKISGENHGTVLPGEQTVRNRIYRFYTGCLVQKNFSDSERKNPGKSIAAFWSSGSSVPGVDQ